MADIQMEDERFDQWLEELRKSVPAGASVDEANKIIRVWYDRMSSSVDQDRARWAGQALELQARRAWSIRHLARMLARLRMPDPGQVAELQRRDEADYGTPHGPNLDWLMRRARGLGCSDEQAFQVIMETAGMPNEEVNRQFGIVRERGER